MSSTSCISKVLYGNESTSNHLQLNGTDIYGTREGYYSGTGFSAIPNSVDAFGGTSTGQVAITRNVLSKLTPTYAGNRTLTYKINAAPNAYISDANNNILSGMIYSTIRFSENGRWMIVDAQSKGMLRIDMETLEVLPFTAGFGVPWWGTWDVQSTITNDGSLAVVRTTDSYNIYDLTTCGSVPSTITGPVSCESKNLLTPLRAQLGASAEPPKVPKFVTNDTISMNVKHTVVSTVTYGRFLTGPAGTSLTGGEYLALGDSFTSGEGAYNYEPETDTAENPCHLSTKSYPYLIADELDYNNSYSVACSGAETLDIVYRGQHLDEPTPNTMGIRLPGPYAQNTHVALNQPGVITVSAMGNDIGFDAKLRDCLWIFTCFDSYEERKSITKEVNNQFHTMTDMFTKIKNAASSSTKIYAVGYPQIVVDEDCGNNVHLNSTEIDFANKFINHVNYVMKQAADYSRVAYLDVSNAFNGYRLCETDNNNFAVNGLTAGDNAPIPGLGPIANESFHPTALGQRLLKSKILDLSDDFATYTVSSSTITPPTLSDTTAVALMSGFTSTSTVIANAQYDPTIAPDIIYHDDDLLSTVSGGNLGLKPSTNYTVEIHSTPVSLGTFATNSSSELEIDVAIPDTIDPGYHTIHIFGQNLAGEPVDVYKGIFVGVSDTDFDGDTVLDSAEDCIGIDAASADVDEDGKDDACDDYIDFSPSEVQDLYRARVGDPGEGEDVDKIYIERDVTIGGDLFDLSDSDANTDGWAIVGVTEELDDTTISNFQIIDKGLTETVTDRFVPTVSIRTPEYGCMDYVPTSLDEVAPLLTRDTASTEDTAHCRAEDPSDDTDSNTINDNLQTLYRARNGDSGAGEDPTKIYIERNVVAAEAVLGQSDFDEDSDGWSIVGISGSLTSTTYNNIILVDGGDNILSTDGAFTMGMLEELSTTERRAIRPIVLMEDGVPACVSLRPTSLTTIKDGESRGTTTVTGFTTSCI